MASAIFQSDVKLGSLFRLRFARLGLSSHLGTYFVFRYSPGLAIITIPNNRPLSKYLTAEHPISGLIA